MNTRFPSLLVLIASLVLALFATGCTTNQSGKIQNFLDTALPATFVGDAHVEHFNPYFDFTIDAQGLRKANGVWVWDAISYHRQDRFTHGVVTLKPTLSAR